MNKMIRTLLTVAALATGSVAFAQPAVKLVTVDVAKVYDGFYKAQDGMAKIQDARQKAQDQAEEYRKQGQLLVDEYKDLVEQSKNTLLTPDAKAKAEQNAQKKLEEGGAKFAKDFPEADRKAFLAAAAVTWLDLAKASGAQAVAWREQVLKALGR